MSSAPRLSRITDPASHDAAIVQASEDGVIVLIYVTSSSNPMCVNITPKVEALAANDKYKQVRFFQMELTPETAPMIKFGIQNTPIFIGYRQRWCQTVLGPDMRGLERMLEGQLDKM